MIGSRHVNGKISGSRHFSGFQVAHFEVHRFFLWQQKCFRVHKPPACVFLAHLPGIAGQT